MTESNCKKAPIALDPYSGYPEGNGTGQKLSTNYQLGTKQFYATNKNDETMPHIVWNDNGGNSTVNFGGNEYVCESMKLFKPSIHTWNGLNAHGELVIEHYSSDDSTVKLIICVPFNLIAQSTIKSQLDDLIVSSTATSSTNIQDISFGHYIPRGEGFAMYDADASYDSSCPSTTDNTNGVTYKYIVFNLNLSSDLHINSDTDAFDDMPDSNAISEENNPTIYVSYNKDGATFANSDIYIKCQPTGNSDEDVIITAPLPSKKSKISILNQYLYYVILVFSTVVVLYVVILFLQYVISKFAKGVTKPAANADGNGQ